tara:strand:- start:207 stop:542 length:336 start_codon:yes stop_codon:yes gene_type:complete
MNEQSNKSSKQLLGLEKDIEHLKYLIGDQKKDQTKINDDIMEAVKVVHRRFDSHLDTEVDFQENVRAKICKEQNIITKRVSHLEQWKWIIFGGIVVGGALLGAIPLGSLFK